MLSFYYCWQRIQGNLPSISFLSGRRAAAALSKISSLSWFTHRIYFIELPLRNRLIAIVE
jgi:hypothetical protein